MPCCAAYATCSTGAKAALTQQRVPHAFLEQRAIGASRAHLDRCLVDHERQVVVLDDQLLHAVVGTLRLAAHATADLVERRAAAAADDVAHARVLAALIEVVMSGQNEI